MTIPRRGILTLGIAAALVGLAGSAMAGLLDFTGSGVLLRRVKTQTDNSTHSGTSFSSLPGASIAVTVPSGTTRLVLARFTAESQCSGPVDQYCAIRIVAFNPATRGTIELHPQVGINLVFHRTASDRFESHSIARTARLPAGSYSVLVQRATTLNAMTFILDDWIFEVDVSS
jgi:hypothetical protein